MQECIKCRKSLDITQFPWKNRNFTERHKQCQTCFDAYFTSWQKAFGRVFEARCRLCFWVFPKAALKDSPLGWCPECHAAWNTHVAQATQKSLAEQQAKFTLHAAVLLDDDPVPQAPAPLSPALPVPVPELPADVYDAPVRRCKACERDKPVSEFYRAVGTDRAQRLWATWHSPQQAQMPAYEKTEVRHFLKYGYWKLQPVCKECDVLLVHIRSVQGHNPDLRQCTKCLKHKEITAFHAIISEEKLRTLLSKPFTSLTYKERGFLNFYKKNGYTPRKSVCKPCSIAHDSALRERKRVSLVVPPPTQPQITGPTPTKPVALVTLRERPSLLVKKSVKTSLFDRIKRLVRLPV